MQLALFGDAPIDGAELLPGSMRSPRLWDQGEHDDPARRSPMCSWCGAHVGYDGSRDATWTSPDFFLISWAPVTERVCPFCRVRPTDLRRAVEIARMLETST